MAAYKVHISRVEIGFAHGASQSADLAQIESID
jgi:hypothetical protein